MNFKIPKPVLKAAREGTLIPFIGSGFSQNLNSENLNLLNRDQLINVMAKKLEWNPEVLKMQGDFYQIAQYYYLENNETISDLRRELNTQFETQEIDIKTSNVHSLIVDLNPPIIYTSNWDQWIEQAFRKKNQKYKAIRSLLDLITLEEDQTPIVKFHGDFGGPDDKLILTEDSYFERLDFESELDIKFRADILEKTVIFMGYSFSDINMRYLWYKLTKLKDKISPKRDKFPKSYIVSVVHNELQEKIFKEINLEVIKLIDADPKIAMEQFLEKLVSEVSK